MARPAFFLPDGVLIMSDLPMPRPAPVPPQQSMHKLIFMTHVIYGLHGFAAFSALLSSAWIFSSFLLGLTSLLAVALNYWYRADVRGTWLDSHFRWQIRTFWWALLWACVGWLSFATIVGIPVAILIFLLLGVWILYRIVRGWLSLLDGRVMPVDDEEQKPPVEVV